MPAKFDPNIEHDPNPILIAVALLVLAGFGVVFMIIQMGDSKTEAAAPAAAP